MMKSQLLALALVAASAFSARADVIAQWNFNSIPADASAGTGSTNATVGSGSLRVVGGTTYQFAGGHTSDPAATDNTAINVSTYPLAAAGNKTAGIRFAVPTTDYANIQVSWSQRHSGTASRYHRLQYSLDGVDFVDTTNVYSLTGTSFADFTADLSHIAGIANNPNFALQIVAEFQDSATGAGTAAYVGTSSTFSPNGTVRIEMMTISGDATGTPNNAPTISSITNVTMRGNSTYPAIAFTVNDVETPAGSLVINKFSSDTTLLPLSAIVIGGSGSSRTVTLTPAINQVGTATVGLTVVDGGGKSNTVSFSVTVIPTNTLPTVSAILNQATDLNTPLPAVAFQIGDAETAAADLTVTAVSSSNPTLLPNSGIVLGGSGSNRTVMLTPVPGELGNAQVTITVSDGTLSTNRSFVLSILPSRGTLAYEPFNYPNGPLVTNSRGLWQTHSGTNGELETIDGLLYVTAENGEDVNIRLRGEPYTVASGVDLYYSFRFSAYNLPGVLGEYFAHLKDNANTFRARLHVSTTNAPLGFYRIAIANGAGSVAIDGVAEFPLDITFDQTNLVVVRYNVGTGISTLWVNPTSESSDSVTASDFISSTNTVSQFAIRESRFQGDLYLDDVRVAKTFGEALGIIPEEYSLRIWRDGSAVKIAWPATASGFTLQSRSDLTAGSWQAVAETPVTEGNENVVTIANPTGTAFYRLVK